jgi:hypothetical protein
MKKNKLKKWLTTDNRWKKIIVVTVVFLLATALITLILLSGTDKGVMLSTIIDTYWKTGLTLIGIVGGFTGAVMAIIYTAEWLEK